ncbi:MAG TPA: TetR/AcrR family transcriptional regulator [Rhodospirillales bacterium]|jgi:AcrR family transcriptional regulator|nr:TetR/AcrR family transcriptional regulator [Rhodospirillales bacterium]HJO96474.1 TetR/AcrR family transcriptional regulator [Rhodospirillales bacterium]
MRKTPRSREASARRRRHGQGRISRIPAQARPGRTKKEQREISVARLLEAALGYFVTEGYRGTTIERIANAAGLTKGAVYFYFKSKAGVLIRLLEWAEESIIDPTIQAIEEAGPQAIDRLVAFMHTQSLVTTERPERTALSRLVLLMSLEFRGTNDPIEKNLDKMMARLDAALTETVEMGKRQGEFRRDLDTRQLVAMIMSINQGCFLEWDRHAGTLDGPAFVRAMRLMVLAGIGTAAAPET